MPNVRNIIDNHNKKIQQNAKTDDTEQRKKSTKSCNYRKPVEWSSQRQLPTKIRNLPSNCNKQKRRIKGNVHWTDK